MGFGPTNSSLEGYCLTTWRRPLVYGLLYSKFLF